MTEQEALIREAIAAEANDTVGSGAVLAALHGKRSRHRPLALFAAVGVTVVAAAVVVVVPMTTAPRTETLEVATPVEPRTVLLAGLDADGRTDSVVLTRIAADGAVSAISLPRDSWVDVPGRGMGKLNSAYVKGSVGGPQDLVRTVEAVTGVHVDHHATVDMASVAEVSTAVGGVEVCLRTPAKDDFSGVDLPAGKQVLSGDQALAFLRQRSGLRNGDLDRLLRQQAFLRSLAGKVFDPAFLRDQTKVAAVLDVLDTGTNWDLLAFVSGLTPNAPIRTATIPHGPESTTPSGVVLSVDPAAVRAFIAEFLSESPRPASSPGAPGDGCVD